MERYAFVLGKNPALSSAEIFSYLKTRGIRFTLQDHTREFLILDLSGEPSLEDLGGSIKLGEVLSSHPGPDLPPEPIREAAALLPERGLFGVSTYGAGWKELASQLKLQASRKGKTCKFMNIPKGRSSLTHVEVIKRALVQDSAEFLLLRGKQAHLARTREVHDPFGFQKRDMDRPFKRPMLSIPPRLCRIMVNLSGQRGGVLLDPFCGIGTVLQEATLMGFTCWGLDLDSEVVSWARRNLKWLLKEYSMKQPGLGERIQRGDARKLTELFPANSLDAIVTEPYLGQPLKMKPDMNKARRVIRDVRPLYERFVKGSSQILKPGGRLVVVSPYFEVGTKNPPVRLNMEQLTQRHGLTLVDPFKGSGLGHSLPLTDSEERHRTIREITVLEAK